MIRIFKQHPAKYEFVFSWCRSIRIALKPTLQSPPGFGEKNPMETRLVRIGDEYALVFDDSLINLLKLTPETQMEVTVQGDAIVLTPIRKPAEVGDQSPLSE
jgi:hypothetical protein